MLPKNQFLKRLLLFWFFTSPEILLYFQLKLMDLSTHEMFLCYLKSKEQLTPHEIKDGIISYDFPLVKPDEEQLRHHLYKVSYCEIAFSDSSRSFDFVH